MEIWIWVWTRNFNELGLCHLLFLSHFLEKILFWISRQIFYTIISYWTIPITFFFSLQPIYISKSCISTKCCTAFYIHVSNFIHCVSINRLLLMNLRLRNVGFLIDVSIYKLAFFCWKRIDVLSASGYWSTSVQFVFWFFKMW